MSTYITSVWLRSDFHRSFETDETFPKTIDMAIFLSKYFKNLYHEEVYYGGCSYYLFAEEPLTGRRAEELFLANESFKDKIKEHFNKMGRENIEAFKREVFEAIEKEEKKVVKQEEYGVEAKVEGMFSYITILGEHKQEVKRFFNEEFILFVKHFKTDKEIEEKHRRFAETIENNKKNREKK